jgi:hypothetical protein
MTNREKPWFVKIKSPGHYKIKPYGRTGWLLMLLWIVVFQAISCLLFIEAVRNQFWIVIVLGVAVTIPLIVLAIRTAVPIEQVEGDKS